jgi:hypothetical protein
LQFLFLMQDKSILQEPIFRFLSHSYAWVSYADSAKHPTHKSFRTCQRDNQKLFKSCQKFFWFSFLTFVSINLSITFQHRRVPVHLYKAVYFVWSNPWFWWSWSHSTNKLSRTLDSNIPFYHTLGRLLIDKEILGSVEWLFFMTISSTMALSYSWRISRMSSIFYPILSYSCWSCSFMKSSSYAIDLSSV